MTGEVVMCVSLHSRVNIVNCDMTGFGKTSLKMPPHWGSHALYPLHFHTAAVETQSLVADAGLCKNKDLYPAAKHALTLTSQMLPPLKQGQLRLPHVRP